MSEEFDPNGEAVACITAPKAVEAALALILKQLGVGVAQAVVQAPPAAVNVPKTPGTGV